MGNVRVVNPSVEVLSAAFAKTSDFHNQHTHTHTLSSSLHTLTPNTTLELKQIRRRKASLKLDRRRLGRCVCFFYWGNRTRCYIAGGYASTSIWINKENQRKV